MKQQIEMCGVYFLFPFLFFLLLACSPANKVSSTATKEEITQAINSDNWVFTAYNSNPQFGRSRGGLTGINEVKYRKDTMTVYLPYFGRLYSGSEVLDNRGPLDFTTTHFEVTKENKKGGWVITVKPKDHSPVQSMVFNLYETGNAQLNVTLTNRSPISYAGTTSPGK